MNFRRIFVTDLDGTLLGNKEQNRKFTRLWSSISDNKSPILVYSTGRLFEDSMRTIKGSGLPCPDYCICGVGTQIFNAQCQVELQDYSALLHKNWDLNVVEDILRNPGFDLVKQPDQFQSEFKSSWYLRDATPEQLATIQETLNSTKLHCSMVYSSNRDLDVLPGMAGKGGALKWLLSRIGILPDETLVAGDSGNDRQMFLVEGVSGIIVGNAQPELLRLSSLKNVYQTEAHGTLGVIEGLIHFGIFEETSCQDNSQ